MSRYRALIIVIIGVASWDLQLFGCFSLKDKRSVIKSLKDRLHHQLNVSVAETAHHDVWDRAELSASVVATGRTHAERVLAAADGMVERTDGCRIIDSTVSFI